MKAAFRWVAIFAAVGVAAAPYAAQAAGPMSNGVGDGEANVPFASPTAGAHEGDRGARTSRTREGGEHRKVAGRSGRAADRGARPAGGADLAPRTDGDRAFEQLIWTAP